MPRAKGSLNHTTRDTNEFLNAGVKNEHSRIEAALLDLFETNKASYLNAITKLLPFISPKASEMHLLTPDTLSKMPPWFDGIPREYAVPREKTKKIQLKPYLGRRTSKLKT